MRVCGFVEGIVTFGLCWSSVFGYADQAKSVVKVEPLVAESGIEIDTQQLSRGMETLKTGVLKSGKFVILGDSENQAPDLCLRGTVLDCKCQPISSTVGGYTFTSFRASCEIRMVFLNGLSLQELVSDTFVGVCETKAKRLPDAVLPQAQREARAVAIDDAMGKVTKFLTEQSQFEPAPGLANVEVFLLEEPPTQGQLKMASAFGSGLDGQKFFLANYSVMQRKIRDLLVLRLTESGADVKLLEGNDAYSAYKAKDQMLVGVFFDPEMNEFSIDNGLIDEVKANSQDAVVVYYRIDAMTYDAATSKLYIGASLNLRNFSHNIYEPYASMPTVEIEVATASREVIMDRIATESASLFDRIWKANGKSAKIAAIAKRIGTVGKDRPLTLQVNATVFDSKVRKRVLYELRKRIVAKQLCAAKDIRSLNDSLKATIMKPDIDDAETLYMEYIYPIFEDLNVELTDDQVTYSGRDLLVKPGKEEVK